MSEELTPEEPRARIPHGEGPSVKSSVTAQLWLKGGKIVIRMKRKLGSPKRETAIRNTSKEGTRVDAQSAAGIEREILARVPPLLPAFKGGGKGQRTVKSVRPVWARRHAAPSKMWLENIAE